MKLKSKFIIFFAVSSLCVVSAPLSIRIFNRALPKVYTNTFYGEMKDKIDLIKNKTDQKRLIIVGGSSVPFSLNSEFIHVYIKDYYPIDFGLYATLGTNLMLDLAKPYIRSDDIVIISPELSKQTLSIYYNGLETWKALESNLNETYILDTKMRESLFSSLPTFVHERFNYVIHNNIPNPTDIYKKSSFNQYGDIKETREGNIMLNGIDSNNMLIVDKDIVDLEFINKLNDFNSSCLAKGAKCYYRFSPMNESSLIKNISLDEFYDYLDSLLNFEILGNPNNSSLEKEWFYDTNYHLNTSGSVKFTKDLIKDVKLILNDSTPTDIKDPFMPELINKGIWLDGDDTDLDCFTYKEIDDGYYIDSINEKGLQKTDLIIPSIYNEKPILYFNEDVFQNNKTCKTITIQQNIKMLYDYSFKDSKIEKVIIKNNEPSSLAVGTNLLDGCDALIYVNKEVESIYKTNYSWSIYSSKIRSIN